MTAEAFRSRGERMPIGPLGLIGLVGAALSTALLWNRNQASFGVVVADNFGLFMTGILVVVGVLSLAISEPTLDRERLPRGEYYALMLFAIGGDDADGDGVGSAGDLPGARDPVAGRLRADRAPARFAGRRSRPRSSTSCSAAFSSAFFLYGIAFTYGVTGSTRLDGIGTLIAARAMSPTLLQLAAVGLLLVGFAFKVSAVPFHMWTPDAYEGAPTAVTGFMSTGVKAAAFAAFVRVFLSAFEPLRDEWSMLVWGIAAATMIMGTVVGVAQTSVKRMLAYSSIAHGGYLLVALVSANDVGKSAVLFYLLTYAVTNIGAFGVVAVLEDAERPNDRIADYAGLWADAPGPGGADDRVPAVARRLSAVRRVHREVVRVQRRGERRLLLAGGHRRADERRLGVLLPADRRDDVHDAVGQPGPLPGGAADRRRSADRLCDSRLLPRHPADPDPRPRPRFDRDDLLRRSVRLQADFGHGCISRIAQR